MRFDIDIVLPEGMTATTEQLHIESSHHEVTKRRPAPATAPPLGPLTHHITKKTKDGFNIVFSHGVASEVAIWMKVWVDANGNGKLDSGDAAGRLSPAPFHGKDHGGCRGNHNKAPTIELTKVP